MISWHQNLSYATAIRQEEVINLDPDAPTLDQLSDLNFKVVADDLIPAHIAQMLDGSPYAVVSGTYTDQSGLLGKGFYSETYAIMHKPSRTIHVAKSLHGHNLEDPSLTQATKVIASDGKEYTLPAILASDLDIANIINKFSPSSGSMYVKLEKGYLVKNLILGSTLLKLIGEEGFFESKMAKRLGDFVKDKAYRTVILDDLNPGNLVYNEEKGWVIVDAHDTFYLASSPQETLNLYKESARTGNDRICEFFWGSENTIEKLTPVYGEIEAKELQKKLVSLVLELSLENNS